jgi:hypothetical protein
MDPWPWIRLDQEGNRHPALEPSERRAETAHPSASTATSLTVPWPKNTTLLATLPRRPVCSSYCQFPALVQHPLISPPPATQTQKKIPSSRNPNNAPKSTGLQTWFNPSDETLHTPNKISNHCDTKLRFESQLEHDPCGRK